MSASTYDAGVMPLQASPIRAARRDRGARYTRMGTVAIWAVSVLAGLIVLIAAAFYLSGGRWFIVETPSMGQVAPVGTLVLDTPVKASALAVGDIITFHPPTAPAETYTHRIVSISKAGAISTRGDINGATDPSTLGQADLVGQVRVIIPMLGWLVRAIPILGIGALLVIFLLRFVESRTTRAAYRISGFSLVVAIAAFILRPFTQVIVLGTHAGAAGAQAMIVSTGILPIRVQAAGGGYIDLVDGQVGTIHVPSLAKNAHYAISTGLYLTFWEWVVAALVCAIPLLWTLIFGLPPEERYTYRPKHYARPKYDPRRLDA
jgi:signal peptidase I